MKIFVTQDAIASLVLAATVFGQAPGPVAVARGDAGTRDIGQLLVEVTPEETWTALADGLLISDGLLVSDGLLISDNTRSSSGHLLVHGDGTARMH